MKITNTRPGRVLLGLLALCLLFFAAGGMTRPPSIQSKLASGNMNPGAAEGPIEVKEVPEHIKKLLSENEQRQLTIKTYRAIDELTTSIARLIANGQKEFPINSTGGSLIKIRIGVENHANGEVVANFGTAIINTENESNDPETLLTSIKIVGNDNYLNAQVGVKHPRSGDPVTIHFTHKGNILETKIVPEHPPGHPDSILPREYWKIMFSEIDLAGALLLGPIQVLEETGNETPVPTEKK